MAPYCGDVSSVCYVGIWGDSSLSWGCFLSYRHLVGALWVMASRRRDILFVMWASLVVAPCRVDSFLYYLRLVGAWCAMAPCHKDVSTLCFCSIGVGGCHVDIESLYGGGSAAPSSCLFTSRSVAGGRVGRSCVACILWVVPA
jgi:hypothetical protein